MKTLADLKRTLTVNTKIIQTFREESIPDVDGNRTLKTVPIPPKLKGVRTITHVDTTGIYMSQTPEDGKRGSFLGFPKAKDLEIDELSKTFTVIDRLPNGETWLKMTYQIRS